MGFAAEVQSQHRRPGTTGCRVHAAVKALGPVDGQDLLAALADPDVNLTAIERALQTRGFRMSYSTIRRFRVNGCPCDAR